MDNGFNVEGAVLGAVAGILVMILTIGFFIPAGSVQGLIWAGIAAFIGGSIGANR